MTELKGRIGSQNGSSMSNLIVQIHKNAVRLREIKLLINKFDLMDMYITSRPRGLH